MLISTLSIPITEVKHGLGKMLDIENALSEKHSKMARLLELERSPSRASLMQDMIGRFGVLRIIQKVPYGDPRYTGRLLEMPQNVCGGDILHVIAYAFISSKIPQKSNIFNFGDYPIFKSITCFFLEMPHFFIGF